MNEMMRKALLKNSEFKSYIPARFLMLFALYAQHTVISYYLYELTGNPFSLGLLGLFEVIPAVGFAFVAGYVADLKEKRNMFLTCLSGYAFIALYFLWICSDYSAEKFSISSIEWLIYGGMFLNGTLRAFISPTAFSILSLLVKRDNLPLAVTWSSSAWIAGMVTGPIVGGLLLAYFNSTIAFSLILACFVVAFLFITTIKQKPIEFKSEGNMLESIKAGFRFIFKTEVILAVLALDLFAVLFAGAEALLPIYAKDILGGGEVVYGWLRSAHGIGSMLMLFILAYLPLKKNVGNKMLLAVFFFGLAIIVFGISKNVYLSFGVLFLAGVFDAISVVIRQSILQLKTPEEMKGRVSSINMMFVSSSNELGAFESGLAARLVGTVPAVVFGGCMTAVVVLAVRKLAPSLRNLDLGEIEN